MALGPRLELRQTQSLVMTPQLRQAIKLLQYSNVEVTSFVEEELQRNPLLERDETAELPATERAAPDQAGKRRVRVQGFPHFVIYHWEPPILRVLAIAHGSREPGYWSDRT